MKPRRLSPTRRERRSAQLAGILSGLLLALPGVFPALAPLQLIALTPLLAALRAARRQRLHLDVGLRMGLAFVGPQLLVYWLPPLISLILTVYFLVLTCVLVWVASWLSRRDGVWTCLAFGAFLAVFDWIGCSALPMWGTAQSFARCWSSYPGMIAFTCLTGITGIMFVLGATQFLIVDVATQPRHRQRRAAAIGLSVLLGAVIGINVAVQRVKPLGHLKVAAVGWAFSGSAEEPGLETPAGFQKLYAQPVAAAATQGARLIVAPEAAFTVQDDSQPAAMERFMELSRRHSLYLVVGYFDVKTNTNRAVCIGPTEGVLATYVKTHLTPFEHHPRGTGEPEIIVVNGATVGLMICHDDNYTDISHRYGGQATAVLAIPTNDWRPVRRAHLQSTIHRAIESRFAIVRAASNGISAIISPTGRMLARSDHFKEGPQVIMADVPFYRSRTIFSRFGNWFVLVCVVYLAAYAILGGGSSPQRRRR